VLTTLRRSLAGLAARRAAHSATADGAARWHRLACAVTPSLIPSFRLLTDLLRQRDDRWGARALAQQAAERFPEESEAWMLLGEAWLAVYRHQEALTAFEQALALAERPDAALAAGDIFRRSGRYAEAAERFSRAYAAGGGPDALRQNAAALYQAGDDAAADQALSLWAQQVPGGASQVAAVRAEMRQEAGKPTTRRTDEQG
jgi:tetratricopeptide (TPR) repeat protein